LSGEHVAVSLNPMVRSSLPVESKTRISPRPEARAGFGIVDCLTASPGTLAQRPELQKPSSPKRGLISMTVIACGSFEFQKGAKSFV